MNNLVYCASIIRDLKYVELMELSEVILHNLEAMTEVEFELRVCDVADILSDWAMNYGKAEDNGKK